MVNNAVPSAASLIASFPHSERENLEQAAWNCTEAMQRLARRDRNVVTSLLRGRGVEFWRHYPRADACDPDSGLCYYYHCHREPHTDPREHGHFHVFLRDDAVAKPAHIAAISVDAHGLPVSACTTNRWVTDERLRDAEALAGVLRSATLVTGRARRNVDRWLGAVLRLFSPQISWLLHRRDECIARLADPEHSFDDRRIQIWTQCPLSFAEQIQALSA